MFSDKLIERLASAINDALTQGEGSWQEKGKELRTRLEEEGANIDEFLTWLDQD